MSRWHGHLTLNHRRDGERTLSHDRHSGPLRVLRSLYPEGPGVCHNVLVHPPAGLAGGDTLTLDLNVGPQAHALLTTPGATRFYRSLGETARQVVNARVDEGARLEWLPLETLCYPQALAENRLSFHLASGAEMLGWDVLALGRPASGQPFDAGHFTQHVELPGVWLERGTVNGSDTRFLNSPLGWAGHSVLGMAWFAAGTALTPERSEALLANARALAENSPLQATAGATAVHAQVLVLRVLGHRVEPVMDLLKGVWAAWRRQVWGLAAVPPRVWQT
ncbi:MAG: urease accessory protein UreD [Pseudomonadota bacterium]